MGRGAGAILGTLCYWRDQFADDGVGRTAMSPEKPWGFEETRSIMRGKKRKKNREVS